MVYSFLTEGVAFKGDYDKDGSPKGVHLAVKNKLLLSPLLASRQLNAEYEKEVRKRQVIVSRDHCCVLKTQRFPKS